MKKITGKRLLVLLTAMILTVSYVTPAFAIGGTAAGWNFLIDAYAVRQTPVTEEECQKIMTNLLTLQEELAEAGIYFMVFIPPDKEEIYGDLLPAAYRLTWPDPLDQLVGYLHENAPDLPVIYPKEALLNARNTGAFDGAELYFANDSHWNYVGGHVGASELIKAVGEHFDHESGVTGHTFSLLPRGEVWPVYTYNEPLKRELDKDVVSLDNGDPVYRSYYSTNPDCWPEKIYFAGDSFRHFMSDPMAEQFKSFICMNRYYLDLDDVGAEAPDVFVLSSVGRMARMTFAEIDGFNTAALPMTNMQTQYGEARWVQDRTGYWWRNPDGTFPTNEWMWLDGNKDGEAECYYFDGNGYCLLNTVTPDGYRVNENGAWIADGVVQVRTAEQQAGQ